MVVLVGGFEFLDLKDKTISRKRRERKARRITEGIQKETLRALMTDLKII